MKNVTLKRRNGQDVVRYDVLVDGRSVAEVTRPVAGLYVLTAGGGSLNFESLRDVRSFCQYRMGQ